MTSRLAWRIPRAIAVVLVLVLVLSWRPLVRAEEPPRGSDVMRQTVQIRNGDKRGSGTVIASVPGETLILTAAHVVKEASDFKVELHRHNLGGRITGLTEGGGWPRLINATLVASDSASDVALLRIKGMVALPYVARLKREAGEPAKGEVLTSVGIDRTLHLTQWKTTVEGAAVIDIRQGGGARPFLVTTRWPDHGRSGGGLFRADGMVVGVCTGQLHIKNNKTTGLFASVESIHRLVREQGLEDAVNPPARRAR
jgi:S1-C subfamily serine protease